MENQNTEQPPQEDKSPETQTPQGHALQNQNSENRGSTPKSRWIIIGIIVAMLITLGIGGAYFLGRNSVFKELNPENPVPLPAAPVIRASPTPTSTSFPETANWQSYTNTEGKYSFKYPSEYKIMENQKYSVDGVAVKTPNTTTILSSELQNLNSNMQISIHYEKSGKELSKDNIATEIGTKTDGYDYSIDGHNGFWFPNTEIGPWGSTIIFAQVNDKDYTITIESAAGYSKTLDRYIAQFLSTFKFTDSEGAFCGGFAGKACPSGYTCRLDGDYPDAGGTCVR